MGYLKNERFLKLLRGKNGFCQRIISKEKHWFELKLSGWEYELKDLLFENVLGRNSLVWSFLIIGLTFSKVSVIREERSTFSTFIYTINPSD